MIDIMPFVYGACGILGWNLGGWIDKRTFHKPVYRNRTRNITIWLRGSKEVRAKAKEDYIKQFGVEN